MAKVEAPSSAVSGNPKKRKGKCRSCLKWFGILLLLSVIAIGILAALFFRIPQKLGILPNAAKRALVMTPDRAGAEALLAEARARGLSTKGVTLAVFPYKNGQGSVAVAVFDSREGFSFSQGGRLNPVGQAFSQIAGGPKADELKIDRIAVTYLSGKGQDLMTLSAKRSDALAFANGGMSEQQFMSVLAGDINLPAIVGEQIDTLKQLSQ